ncbi:unnamed protein product [Mycena citricolor]|uniref:Uncharacterized protein n=1 Tax=Mycena citricolor TaxID=2018698 RepID=A0AAD2HMI2_9AGAR|nr:unnamed protein product [Mycena citricolor]
MSEIAPDLKTAALSKTDPVPEISAKEVDEEGCPHLVPILGRHVWRTAKAMKIALLPPAVNCISPGTTLNPLSVLKLVHSLWPPFFGSRISAHASGERQLDQQGRWQASSFLPTDGFNAAVEGLAVIAKRRIGRATPSSSPHTQVHRAHNAPSSAFAQLTVSGFSA